MAEAGGQGLADGETAGSARRAARPVSSSFLGVVAPAIGLLLLLALALWLDRQTRTSVQVDVGRSGDVGYLVAGFYGREQTAVMPTASGTEPADFRWTADGAELRLVPLAAGTPYVLRLRLLGLEPAAGEKAPTLTLTLNGQAVLTTTVLPYLAEYTVAAPAQAGGELQVGLQVTPSTVVESRVLGVVVDRVSVRAVGGVGAGAISFLYPLPPYAIALLAAFAGGWLAGLAAGWRLLPPAAAGLLGLLAWWWQPARAPHLGALLAVAAVTALVVLGVRRLLGHLAPRPRAWPRWLLVVFLVCLLAVFVPALQGDGLGYYAYLRSLTMDGDLDFSNDLSPALNPYQSPNTQALDWRTPTGLVVNAFSVGPALLWSPFYGLAHLMTLAGHSLGLPWEPDGFAEPYILLVTFGSALFSLAAMVLLYALCRRLFSPGGALAGTLLTFLGTTWFYYTFLEGSFPHALGAFAVTLFLFVWWRTGEDWGWPQGLALGFSAGVMCLVYWIHALFLVVLVRQLWEFGRAVWKKEGLRWQRQLGGWVAFAAAVGVTFAPQLAAWKVLYGQFLAVPQGSSFIAPGGFWLGPLLFSPLHGLFLWTPVTLLAIVGLFFLVRRVPRRGWVLVVALLLYILYNAVLESWHGKGAFGIRRLTSAAPFFALGLAALWDAGKRFRFPWIALLGSLTTVWHFLVLLRYRFYALPHDVWALADLRLSEFILGPGNAPLSWGVWLVADGLLVGRLRACLSGEPESCAVGLCFVLLLTALSVGLFCLLRRWLRLGQEGPAGPTPSPESG